jgi:hypothetical protein
VIDLFPDKEMMMAEVTHAYVVCDCCQTETRKDGRPGGIGGGVCIPPEGWLMVVNRLGKRMWDVCPECSKAFTKWLLKRAGHMIDEASTKRTG